MVLDQLLLTRAVELHCLEETHQIAVSVSLLISFLCENEKKTDTTTSACECYEETRWTYFQSHQDSSQLFSDIKTVLSENFSLHLSHATNAINAKSHLSNWLHAISHLSHAILHHISPRHNIQKNHINFVLLTARESDMNKSLWPPLPIAAIVPFPSPTTTVVEPPLYHWRQGDH